MQKFKKLLPNCAIDFGKLGNFQVLTLEEKKNLQTLDLTSNELDKWQQLLKTLEEDRLSTMNDFNEKLKSLL